MKIVLDVTRKPRTTIICLDQIGHTYDGLRNIYFTFEKETPKI